MSLLLRRSCPGRLSFREKGGPAGRFCLPSNNFHKHPAPCGTDLFISTSTKPWQNMAGLHTGHKP